ncbi:hypothetical protein ELH80_00845 [Rhizobium ruizarguesonis]|jgi:hypothetical protein|uniref:hypothetical protein n=2 Tax=Rhizobium ruizarguesonis TaxID=2081791 RepID=UPI001030D095|nr:hypothetical protein [Rhizobium ruizarguesonis]MBY5890998.1 hypothetical protein [Rhizobium leguminosarum]QSZ01502.1 hypothetical protein J3P73_03000 [Rhizobium ruizarguesonis]TAY77630.1 hypothetical protein ELH86_00845 [Rhizobium ruizarguesonis]TAZ33109.1 hypothetical protein ELH80_00845 [Rhizobium ruizarguesonis]TBA56681.1 hypothetical protein ELH59_00855 [Rhizobium ruizarguesonis]
MMRRAFVVVVGMVCLVYAAWHVAMTRSTTIRLEPPGYELTYSMAWGWGMEERWTIRKFGALWSSPSSKWTEIWKKPYNSGMVVYASDDGQTYYFGTGYGLHFFQPKQGAYWTTCEKGNIPKRTPLAERLSFFGSDPADEDIDPGTPRLFEYIRANDPSGAIPSSPPPSRYYAGLKYLGKFGLVATGGQGRGNEVRFVPAGNSIEPRLGLQFSCG